jgi:hypothetical protein
VNGGCSFDRAGLGTAFDGATGDVGSDGGSLIDARLEGGERDGSRLDAASDGLPQDQSADLSPADSLAQDGPAPDALPDVLALDVLAPDVLAPDTLAPDTLAPDTLAPDLLAPDVFAPDTGFPCAQCALGCDASLSRCKVLVPSTLTLKQVLIFDSIATADCDLSPSSPLSYLVNTTSQSFSACPGAAKRLFTQANGPAIAVFAFNTLRLGSNAQLRVTGDRAVLFYARRTIVVEGTLDATASLHTPGPGGKAGRQDDDGTCWFVDGEGQAGEGKDENDSGGGGGAWGEDGKRGGNSGGGQKGGPGGDKASAPASVFGPFHGGCSGGAGASNSDAGHGGGGGGAVHLAAGLSVTISGVVTAGGGGGGGGKTGEAGGGGGSGGTILLESQTVTTSGTLSANGGAGGSGAAPSAVGTNGNPGANGTPNTVRAVGGASVDGDSGKGGLGGALQDAANGQDKENAGGGGGGAGRIHVRSGGGSLGGWRSPPQTSDNQISIQ